MESTMTCPHCHTEVPYGATVCRGCQAEVDYVPPGSVYVGSIIGALIVAWMVSRSLPHVLSPIGCVLAFVGVMYLTLRGIRKRYPRFMRRYRTK